MHFLVTGANGLVGSRLVRLLALQGHRVTAMGRGARRFQRVSGPAGAAAEPGYLDVDLGDAAGLTRALFDARPEVIVNPAGLTDVDGCEKDPDAAWVANVEGVATLCRAAKKLGAHLVHVSTDYVFDGQAGPYDVDAVPNPRGTYALTKHAGEQAVRALAAPGAWAIARTAVVYGWPNAGKHNFGSWLVESLRAGKQVKLFADQWVSASLALNVAEMLAELAARKLTGLWHVAGAEVVDRVTFGKRLCARFSFDERLIAPSSMAEVKLLSPRPAKSGLLVARTAQALDAKPLGLAASLDRFFAECEGSARAPTAAPLPRKETP